jgi:hypothetical protein
MPSKYTKNIKMFWKKKRYKSLKSTSPDLVIRKIPHVLITLIITHAPRPTILLIIPESYEEELENKNENYSLFPIKINGKMQTQPAKKSEPWEKLKWSPCFMTHSMEKVHTDMIILVSEVIGSIIYETYKSLKNSYDTEVLRIMFSNEFLFGTVSEVFKLMYTMLSDELLQESFSKKDYIR